MARYYFISTIFFNIKWTTLVVIKIGIKVIIKICWINIEIFLKANYLLGKNEIV